jgi:pimeloyl-ACP methyl ester carboxylesterase
MPQVQQSSLVVADCKVSYQRSGAGPTLLFLHGARGANQWTPFFGKLAETFDVVVPEHPGYGLSDTPDWLDTIDDVAYFYLDLIEALKLSDIHLVGTSLGGWIAAEIAIRQAQRLKTITLVAPAGIHVKGVQKGDIFLWSKEESAKNLFHDQALAKAMLEKSLSEDEQDLLLKNNLMTARLAWQPRLYNPHLYKWLHRIKLPTLLVWGEDDKVIPPAYGPAYQRLIPGSKLVKIPNCGHLPQVEKWGELASIVTNFIKEI